MEDALVLTGRCMGRCICHCVEHSLWNQGFMAFCLQEELKLSYPVGICVVSAVLRKPYCLKVKDHPHAKKDCCFMPPGFC